MSSFESAVGLARQTDLATVASAVDILIPWRDLTATPNQEYVRDDGNRGIRSAVFSVYPNVQRPELRIGSYAYPEVVPLVVGSILGSIATSGAAAPYTHDIVPADTVIPLTAFVFDKPKAQAYRAFVPTEIEFSWGGADGFVTMNVNGVALEAADTSVTKPTTMSDEPPFIGKSASYTHTLATGMSISVSGKVVTGTLRIARDLDRQWTSEHQAAAAVVTPDRIDVTGNLTVLYDTSEDFDRGLLTTTEALTITFDYTGGDGVARQLVFEIPKIFWGNEPFEIDRSNPTLLLRYSWTAVHDNTVGGPIKVTVKNTKNAY